MFHSECHSYINTHLIRCACDLYTASNLRFGTEVSLAFGYKGETLPMCRGDTNKVHSFIMFFKNCFDHYITYNAQKFSRTFREILNIVK